MAIVPDLPAIDIFDDPTDWKRCFGLGDNPFAPRGPQGDLDFSKLDISKDPLCPNRKETASLYPDYYAFEFDHYQLEWKKFVDYAKTLDPQRLRDGIVILVQGPSGAGKATFANTCRATFKKSLEKRLPVFQCDIQADRVALHEFQSLDQLVVQVRDDVAKQGKDGGQDERAKAITLILLTRLTQPIVAAAAAPDLPRQYLARFMGKVKELGVNPLVLATTSDAAVFESFSNLPDGDKTEAKEFTIGELSGEEVVKYVERRLAVFRKSAGLAAPKELPLFPFLKEVIVGSFETLDKRRDGRLPFRNVNRILASAVKLKKTVLVERDPPLAPYAADLEKDELESRCIDRDALDSAIRPLL